MMMILAMGIIIKAPMNAHILIESGGIPDGFLSKYRDCIQRMQLELVKLTGFGTTKVDSERFFPHCERTILC
jgi:hypothetical protein